MSCHSLQYDIGDYIPQSTGLVKNAIDVDTIDILPIPDERILPQLSPRELLILCGLKAGLRHFQVAEALKITRNNLHRIVKVLKNKFNII